MIFTLSARDLIACLFCINFFFTKPLTQFFISIFSSPNCFFFFFLLCFAL